MKHSAAIDKKKIIILAAVAVLVIVLIVIINAIVKNGANNRVENAVESSVVALKGKWATVYDDINELVISNTFATDVAEDRKLEIRGVRVIDINPEAHENYKDIEYVVEFTLYSNRYRTAPYYVPEDIYNTVLVYADGKCEVKLRNVFKTMADNFKNDNVKKLVEKVYDYKDEYDTIINLNK